MLSIKLSSDRARHGSTALQTGLAGQASSTSMRFHFILLHSYTSNGLDAASLPRYNCKPRTALFLTLKVILTIYYYFILPTSCLLQQKLRNKLICKQTVLTYGQRDLTDCYLR